MTSDNASKNWWLVDAKGKVLGRLAARVSRVLTGKDKPVFTPNRDMGDHVVIINAKDIVLRGNKLEQKFFAKHTKFPSGLKIRTAKHVFEKEPADLLYRAVSGMMPKTALGRKMLKKLHVYPEAAHVHEGQKPKLLSL